MRQYWLTQAILSLLMTTLAIMAAPLKAEPESEAHPDSSSTRLEVSNETGKIIQQELTSGPVKVRVNYQPINFEQPERPENNLQVEIFYAGKLALTTTKSTYYFGAVELQDLDSNGSPEVIIQTFTGGAHCCMAITTYTWQDAAFKAISFAPLDGGGGQFKDLNQDGNVEFITVDNAFYYAFSSYAGSFPPSIVLTFENGRYVDRTANFTNYLHATAQDMAELVQQNQDNAVDHNGVLASYVAQKIRLGEYQSGWDFMIAHYNPKDEWGLDKYDQEGNVVGQYPDFPSALRGFLTQFGYLDSLDKPQPQVNRSPVTGF